MKRQPLPKFWACSLAAILLCTAQVLYAEVTGTILGTVVDSSGAAVANANVTLHNLNTGLVRKVKTNADGTYEFLSVPVGENYSVQIELSGFQTTALTGIKLDVNQK